jgi:hypothetical protein
MATNRTREPLRGAFIAILAAAIGTLGTLAGNQLASANARDQLYAQLSHDDGVRQYESRRDAYTKFVSVASQARMDLIRVAVQDAEAHRSTTEAELKEVLGDNAQVSALCSNVQVIGSAKAATLALAIRGAFEDILESDDLSTEQIVSSVPRLKSVSNTWRAR